MLLCIYCSLNLSAQQRTVGILQAEDEAYLRYQLFISVDQPYAALIDMCGAVVNEWELDETGFTADFLPDGNLLVSGRINDNTFNRPGKTGLLQIRSWENDLLWETSFTDGRYAAHHDFDVMPNGNILVTLWERFDSTAAINLGRDTSITDAEIWPEAIFEIKPVGTDTFDVVWEWHLWDHLIQDRDSSLENFGVIDEHPERFDINYETRFNDDWNHANSIDYNEARDEIVLGSRDWSEFYVIDHSTTSSEAATSSGGNAGKGGDILYRWGNPRAYGRGNETNLQINAQHDVSYDVARSTSDTLLFTAFSNNNNLPDFSSAVDVTVPLTASGSFIQPENFQAYGPDSTSFTFDGNPSGAFNSPFMGSYDVLPNGNILVTSAILGEYFEYNPEGQLVWNYKVPVGLFGIMTQGDSINGRVFKAYPYELDDLRLAGRDLTPIKKAVELNPLSFDCPYDILSDLDDLPELASNTSQLAYLNSHTISLTYSTKGKKRLSVYDMNGRESLQSISADKEQLIDLSSLAGGLYVIRVVHTNEAVSEIFKIVIAE